MRWDAAQLAERYAEDGYVILPGVVDPGLCADLASAIAARYASLEAQGWTLTEPGAQSGNLAILAGAAGAPLAEALAESGVIALAEALAATSLVASPVSGNYNLPGSVDQDFHADSTAENAFVILNVALVDTDTANGATELVQGSHREPLTLWQLHRSEWRARRTRPELRAGDVMIRTSTLWHRGTTNHSANARPLAALILTPAACADGGSVNTGPIAFHGNRYYGRFAALREGLALHTPRLNLAVRLASSRLATLRKAHNGQS